MLEEPILWARLIDFDILHTLRSETWALELIRRSKTAPLWVRGAKLHCEVDRNGYRFLKPYSFLLTVVDVHWERIQRLVLMAHVLMFIDMSFCPIYRPAPLLDTFHIQFEQSALTRTFQHYAPLCEPFRRECPDDTPLFCILPEDQLQRFLVAQSQLS